VKGRFADRSATRTALHLALGDDAAHLQVVPQPLGIESQQHVVFVVVAVILVAARRQVESKVGGGGDPWARVASLHP
jgi:hypothetical protein